MSASTARRVVLFGALTLLGVATHSPPALAVAPCATANDQCVVIPPTTAPQWTSVPSRQNGVDGQASYLMSCGGASRIGGADWTAPANNRLSVNLSLFQDGWPPPAGGFHAANSSLEPSTFAAFLGCVGAPSAGIARAAGPGRTVEHRVKTLRVRPMTRVTASSRCRRGGPRLRGGAAVVFDSRPTRAELRNHDYRYTVGDRGVRVRLTAGRTVGDDERVVLRVHAACRQDPAGGSFEPSSSSAAPTPGSAGRTSANSVMRWQRTGSQPSRNSSSVCPGAGLATGSSPPSPSSAVSGAAGRRTRTVAPTASRWRAVRRCRRAAAARGPRGRRPPASSGLCRSPAAGGGAGGRSATKTSLESPPSAVRQAHRMTDGRGRHVHDVLEVAG